MTLSQDVSLSKCFHPYRERSRDSHQTTLGRSKQQFFRRGPAGKVGFRQSQSPASRFQHRKAPSLQYNSQNPPPPIIWGSPRGNPRQASSTSQRLYGSPLRHDPSYTECRQTCRKEYISVHTKLAQANPRSVGPGYCSGISPTSCSMARPTAINQEGRRQSTISFGGRGAEVSRKRGCTAGTVVPGIPSQSSVCCPQKRGRLEANYRPKTTELLPGASSFQNGGFVHANGGPEARMANGKDRPERCIPDNPSGKGTPLSTIIPGTARRMDTISVPPIRTLHRTLCIHKGDQANSPIPMTVGNPPDYISG